MSTAWGFCAMTKIELVESTIKYLLIALVVFFAGMALTNDSFRQAILPF